MAGPTTNFGSGLGAGRPGKPTLSLSSFLNRVAPGDVGPSNPVTPFTDYLRRRNGPQTNFGVGGVGKPRNTPNKILSGSEPDWGRVRNIIGFESTPVSHNRNWAGMGLKHAPPMTEGKIANSMATKDLAEGVSSFVNKAITHRFTGVGLMGLGAVNAFNNTRDGHYGKAALGAGAAYMGFQIYKDPRAAAGIANNLLKRLGSTNIKSTNLVKDTVKAAWAAAKRG